MNKKPPKDSKDADTTSLTILAHGWRRCACGYIMIGPAYTAIDRDGYLWRCPGCALRKLKPPP